MKDYSLTCILITGIAFFTRWLVIFINFAAIRNSVNCSKKTFAKRALRIKDNLRVFLSLSFKASLSAKILNFSYGT